MTDDRPLGSDLIVEDLGAPPEPEAGEPGQFDPGPDDDLEGPPVDEGEARQQAAILLVPLLRSGFHVAGLAASRRLERGPRRDRVVELWGVSDAEASPAAAAIAQAIPARWLTSRLLTHSPLVAALVSLGGLLQVRLAETAAIYQEETDASDADREPLPPRAGRPAGADRRGAAGEPPAPGPGAGGSGHTSAGLGLDGPGEHRAAGRRQRRRPAPAGA